MARKKFYAVAQGRKPGIYRQWAEAEKQVKGFGGAKYKSFPTMEEAESWLENPVYAPSKKRIKEHIAKTLPTPAPGSVTVYTDGGAINNPGPGGYGVVICRGDTHQELSGGYRLTTNNRMEMMAAIMALKELEGIDDTVVLYSDSSYLVNGMVKGWVTTWQSNGWRKSDTSPVLNSDLWKLLVALTQDKNVDFRWVKGHAGVELNERCDQLAVSAAKSNPDAIDIGYEESVD